MDLPRLFGVAYESFPEPPHLLHRPLLASPYLQNDKASLLPVPEPKRPLLPTYSILTTLGNKDVGKPPRKLFLALSMRGALPLPLLLPKQHIQSLLVFL